MPLVWAHSEFIKLCCSRAKGYPVDRPVATWARYQGKRPDISHAIWGPRHHPRQISVNDQFSVVLRDRARIHWGHNGWLAVQDSMTSDTGLGVHRANLPLVGLKAGDTIQFTFYWLNQSIWEGKDYEVLLVD
jgi:glucoamylase